MPRIDAATVAEHHLKRRRALLAAAAALMASDGVEAVTLGAVGAAAGLARSSVYQYFDSSAALIAAVVEDAIPRAAAELARAVAAEQTPGAKVAAWVRAYVAAVTDPAHRALAEVGGLTLPADCQERIDALHAARAAPLVAALSELGTRDPALTAWLVEGIARAAAERINDGAPPEHVQRRTLQFVADALR